MHRTGSPFLEWHAIIVACIIQQVVSVFVGTGWGILGLLLCHTSGPESMDAITGGALASIVGLEVSLVPQVIACIYLARIIIRDARSHCLVFGVISLLLSAALACASGDFILTCPEILYDLVVVPAALPGGIIGDQL